MKLLIITATAGEGHNSIAKATANYYQSHHPDVEVLIHDLYKPEHPIMAFLLNDFHFMMLKRFPNTARFVYYMNDRKHPNPNHNYSQTMSKLSHSKFKKIIDEFKPDAIFCVHVFAAGLIRFMVKEGEIPASTKTYFIISDFALHPDSENAIDFDYIFTPNALIHDKAKEKMFHEEKLIPFGLPSDEQFGKTIGGRVKIREELKIPLDAFTVILFSGGMGVANNLRFLKETLKAKGNVFIIVMNGRNEKLREEVEGYIWNNKLNNVINYGFTPKMAELMEASDCLVGKLGGATMFESFVKELPIVVPFYPPFQEYWNLKFLLKYKAVKFIKKPKNIASAIEELIAHPEEINMMKEGIRLMKKEDSLVNICEFIIKTTNLESNNMV